MPLKLISKTSPTEDMTQSDSMNEEALQTRILVTIQGQIANILCHLNQLWDIFK